MRVHAGPGASQAWATWAPAPAACKMDKGVRWVQKPSVQLVKGPPCVLAHSWHPCNSACTPPDVRPWPCAALTCGSAQELWQSSGAVAVRRAPAIRAAA